jgi:hypothetical protein
MRGTQRRASYINPLPTALPTGLRSSESESGDGSAKKARRMESQREFGFGNGVRKSIPFRAIQCRGTKAVSAKKSPPWFV